MVMEINMKWLWLGWAVCLLGCVLTSCQRTSQSYKSEEYRKGCQQSCQEDYGTDVDWVGLFSGKCYCK